MSDALSSSSLDAITRSIQLPTVEKPEDLGLDLQTMFEITETADEIIKRNFRRVALQFPDELLQFSVPIYLALKAKLPEKELFVMADTSYGSCCVDEVAAQHVDAEVVVHYGHACLSPTSRLPTIYVFPRKELDVDGCVKSLLEISDLTSAPPDRQVTVRLILDVSYHVFTDTVLGRLRADLPESIKASTWKLESIFVAPGRPHSAEVTPSQGRSSTYDLGTSGVDQKATSPAPPTILYIGGQSLALMNILVMNPQSPVFSFDPVSNTSRLESKRTNALLMRRYAVIQKARDADVFGILVGTLGVESYLPVISHLRRIISRHKRKSYTVSVGKLNPAKLANFMEIECFVLVACPENSLIDSKEFFRPVITPHELVLALNPEIDFPGNYTLNFSDVLAQDTLARSDAAAERPAEVDDDDDDSDQPSFSLVSGTYHHHKRFRDQKETTNLPPQDRPSDVLVQRTPDRSLALFTQSAAAQYLNQRTFQGLEQNIGRDEPSVLEQGRSGVAQGYGEAA